MLKSMTGFGRAEQVIGKKTFLVEIKSLNGKQFEILLKLPSLLKAYEFDIRNMLSEKLLRGSIDCTITLKQNGAAKPVGIAGGVEIGNGVTLWGQVGVNKTLTIGDNVTVLAQSGVPGSLAGNNTYFGTPAENASIKRRELVWVKRIPELWKKEMES